MRLRQFQQQHNPQEEEPGPEEEEDEAPEQEEEEQGHFGDQVDPTQSQYLQQQIVPDFHPPHTHMHTHMYTSTHAHRCTQMAGATENDCGG